MDMLQECNRINDSSSALEFMEQADNNEIVFPIELTNTTDTTLHRLNEDCLLEIFSSNSLTPSDLCSLERTCERFKEIIRNVFPKEFDIVVGSTKYYRFESKHYSECLESVQIVEQILTSFGPFLCGLVIDGYDPIVANLVAQYCGGGTLKRLDICRMDVFQHIADKFKSIFEQLLVLSFHRTRTYVEYPQAGVVLQLNCDSLTELVVNNVVYCSAILKNTFPKLERFMFESFAWSNYDGSDSLVKFIGRHRNLKILYLFVRLEYFCDALTHAISECMELDELSLKSCDTHEKISFNLSKLHNLPKLKKFELDFDLHDNKRHVEPFKAIKSLEILKISCMDHKQIKNPVKVVDALSQLPHLRKLHLLNFPHELMQWTKLTQLTKLHLLNHSFFDTDILKIVSQLTNLEKLKIYGWNEKFVLYEELYSEIVKIVEKRSKRLTLKCEFKFGKNFSTNCTVVQMEKFN